MPSSAIEWFGYDDEHRRLLVRFRGKKRKSYAYLGVPRREYEALKAAPSKGIYINTVIKPRYEVEPI
jgi:hypothetical protein